MKGDFVLCGTAAKLITALVSMIRQGDEQEYELYIHRKKRTLNQNSYYWQLLGKVARLLGKTNTELHNEMIADYGFVDSDIGYLILKDSIDWRQIPFLHLKPTTRTKVMDNGVLCRAYYVMRGSSTYNTTEMSRLLDGMIQEAHAQGIETMTPAQLERMRRDELEAEERRRKRGGVA